MRPPSRWTAPRSKTRALSRWRRASVQLGERCIGSRRPDPGDGREDDRRHPRQDYEEAHDPLAAKVADEDGRAGAPTTTMACEASVKMSVLRSARRKLFVVPGIHEVVEADPVTGQRTADRVREAQIDGPDKRDAHDERHDGRRDAHDRENATGAAATDSHGTREPRAACVSMRPPADPKPCRALIPQ